METFFRQAKEAKFVVLRWFDTLPQVAPGEDIDMLVADDDLPLLARLLDNKSGGVPCDVYTVSGIAGTQYRGGAYFPRQLASRTLTRRVMRDELYPTPSEEDYFFGLAYHAVYQKGPASGLRSALPEVTPNPKPDHDYSGILRELGASIGIAATIDLESLDRLLAEHGLRPDHETLRRLSEKNEWITHRFLLN